MQSQYGIIPRAIRDIFTFMNHEITHEGALFELSMMYLEIYMESLNDLLQKNASIGDNLKMNGNKIINAMKMPVSSPEEIFYYI